jgi:hypothetical protein
MRLRYFAARRMKLNDGRAVALRTARPNSIQPDIPALGNAPSGAKSFRLQITGQGRYVGVGEILYYTVHHR